MHESVQLLAGFNKLQQCSNDLCFQRGLNLAEINDNFSTATSPGCAFFMHGISQLIKAQSEPEYNSIQQKMPESDWSYEEDFAD